MGGSAEFQSDVGQAVMGNVNEAPRLNNVVHVNLTGEQHQPKPITNLQRKSIAAKVKELIQLGDMDQLDVYRVILTESSVETIAELPAEQYKSVMAMLDEWIAETKGDTQPPLQRRATDQIPPAMSIPIACIACEKSFKAARDARMMTIMQTMLILVASAILGWLIWSLPVDSEGTTTCHVDGKAYSIGSTVKMMNGVLRECLPGGQGGVPYWGASSVSKGNR